MRSDWEWSIASAGASPPPRPRSPSSRRAASSPKRARSSRSSSLPTPPACERRSSMSASGTRGRATACASGLRCERAAAGVPYAPERSARISSDTSAQRRAVSTWVTACPARMPPIGCASGAVPQSARTWFSSASTSSRRSSASAARRRASMSATRPTGRREMAVRRMIRGGTGRAGMRDVTCASMNRDASQTRSTSTPCSISRPGQRLAQDLGRHPVQERRHRIGRDRDRLGAVAGGLDRHCERLAAGALAVEARGHARPPRPAARRRWRRCRDRARRRSRAGAPARPPGRPAGGPSRSPARGCPSGPRRPGRRRAGRPPRAPRRPPRPGSRRRSAGRAGGRRRSRSRPPTG